MVEVGRGTLRQESHERPKLLSTGHQGIGIGTKVGYKGSFKGSMMV